MYLDPGFGSMVLQFILAGVLGAGIFIRLFWKKIKGLFLKNKNEITEINNDIDYGKDDN